MTGTFKQVKVFKEGNSGSYVNINLLATSPTLVPAYVSDRWVGATYEYSMTLDVTALSNTNGTSLEGRTKTIKTAKLALLAMARNMHDLSNGQYRLWLRFFGLPSQTGLPGTRLYATTSYAYSSASPLLAAYEHELINLVGSCQ
jgi:hypothetical protein